jgi:hypothetical protein
VKLRGQEPDIGPTVLLLVGIIQVRSSLMYDFVPRTGANSPFSYFSRLFDFRLSQELTCSSFQLVERSYRRPIK